jgi:hypothetical protein
MRVTVEFQRGKPFASVKRLHTISALARMLTSTSHVIAKVVLVCVNLGSLSRAFPSRPVAIYIVTPDVPLQPSRRYLRAASSAAM